MTGGEVTVSSIQSDPAGLAGRKCLVLGAGGFLGQALARALTRAGAEVTGFGRNLELLEGLTPTVRRITGHFDDTTALRAAMAGQEIVFHLIGTALPAESNRDPALDVAASLLPTIALLEAARSAGTGKLVFASSGGTVYGVPAAVPITEAAATDPITAYGITKLAIEKYLALYRRLHGLDYQILRISNAFGPGQSPVRGQGVVAAMLQKVLRGEPVEIWGDGSVVRDFIHIDDVATALLAGARYGGPHRVFNAGSGVGRSLLSVVHDLIALKEDYREAIAFRAGRLSDVPSNVLDCSLIERETGWRPAVAWEDGISETAAWMRRQSGSA